MINFDSHQTKLTDLMDEPEENPEVASQRFQTITQLATRLASGELTYTQWAPLAKAMATQFGYDFRDLVHLSSLTKGFQRKYNQGPTAPVQAESPQLVELNTAEISVSLDAFITKLAELRKLIDAQGKPLKADSREKIEDLKNDLGKQRDAILTAFAKIWLGGQDLKQLIPVFEKKLSQFVIAAPTVKAQRATGTAGDAQAAMQGIAGLGEFMAEESSTKAMEIIQSLKELADRATGLNPQLPDYQNQLAQIGVLRKSAFKNLRQLIGIDGYQIPGDQLMAVNKDQVAKIRSLRQSLHNLIEI